MNGVDVVEERDVKDRVVEELTAARRRSLAILEPLDDEAQARQHSPLMSPLAWDLAHMGNYEELWLLRAAAAHPGVQPSIDHLYDAFRHPRADRPALPLLSPPAARAYVAEVRDQVLEGLDRLELEGAGPLLDGAFVYGMVIQHEHQHDETMLATRQLMGEAATPLGVAPPTGPDTTPRTGPAQVLFEAGELMVDGGTYSMGTDLDPWAYDNERPAHHVTIDPFWIDTAPVTCGQYAAFVEDGGYHDPRWWVPEGWAWRNEAGLERPEFWRREGEGAWSVLRFGHHLDLRPNEPVQHVCWYEADACARWMGKRLPTEAEWEVAACSAPARIRMVGEVWEWTGSDFTAYPGFRSFPYREYSEVFFGPEYKVLRGGSWATSPLAVRNTFRNWDYPIRRQIFSGFRCARDADRP